MQFLLFNNLLDTSSVSKQKGNAYIFIKPGGGWSGIITESALLTPSPYIPTVDNFGSQVAISDSNVIVGGMWVASGGVVHGFTEPVGGWNGSLMEDFILPFTGFTNLSIS